MIPDLIRPLSKQTKTRRGFIAFLNNLVEEGIAKITTYSRIWNKDVNANVITAVTDDVLRDGRRNWAKMGFLSRFIVFSYSYSDSAVTLILHYYSTHGVTFENVNVKLPRRRVNVTLPETFADQLDPIAIDIGKQYCRYGLRAKINFRCLLKCLAYRNGRRIVTDGDVHEFLELVEYMNFDCHLL
jgi:hypothetical protein